MQKPKNKSTNSVLHKVPFDDSAEGLEADQSRRYRVVDQCGFSDSSVNRDPKHLPNEDGGDKGTIRAVSTGVWAARLILAVHGCRFQRGGTHCPNRILLFVSRVCTGDVLTVKIRQTGKAAGCSVPLDIWVEDHCDHRGVAGEIMFGAKFPLIPTSWLDTKTGRLATSAIALLADDWIAA